ncbi:DEDD exonuclease domain-containing protein [Nigerium massiliense]|uniref:DEDD exonuclease domain-containing protein n=1 Tax=Nigerium massiliense TaxID=1522317 RepID=UPI0005907735|nr:DEDD exonuclease domain-containing protein [Nigerium massiliense]
MTATASFQPSFTDLGRHLATVPFVVVDLETTGSSADDTITEVGAVKVCGGETLGEFQSLVNPHVHIPPLISVLTGITDSLVATAPALDEVLPAFLEFARGCVIVAHNARFDVGFLRRECERRGYPWDHPDVVDTVGLARGVLTRDEVPNCKLATLARHFRVAEAPNHRALTDARATVEVLHGLLERVGNLGVSTLEDLGEFTRGVSPERRAKRVWAHDLPHKPGVYQFYADLSDADGRPRREVLYVGKSVDIATRVRSYFTASEKRPRMEEMVRIASGVEATVCRTPLEAEVLELRLIARHAPRYNRRSKFPQRQVWLKLTDEAFPRLSIVTKVGDDGASYFGPMGGRTAAEQVLLGVYDAYPLRQCTERLSPRKPRTACALGEMGRCCRPCDASVTVDEYAEVAAAVRDGLTRDIRPVLQANRSRLRTLVQQERFEEAGQLTIRAEALLRSSLRFQRIASLARCPEIVAAYAADGGWEIHVIRFGRLAASAFARRGEVPQAVARDAVRVAETVARPHAPLPAGLIEETERIAAWLERPGVRLMTVEGDWNWPINSGVPADELPRQLLG